MSGVILNISFNLLNEAIPLWNAVMIRPIEIIGFIIMLRYPLKATNAPKEIDPFKTMFPPNIRFKTKLIVKQISIIGDT
jgi:hypothetical protein